MLYPLPHGEKGSRVTLVNRPLKYEVELGITWIQKSLKKVGIVSHYIIADTSSEKNVHTAAQVLRNFL